MRSTEQWLSDKVAEYKANPQDALLDHLVSMQNAVSQFLNNPESKAAKGLLETGYYHTELFLETINETEK